MPTRRSRWPLVAKGAALAAGRAGQNHGIETDLANGLELERVNFASLFATEDREIGMTSSPEHGPGEADFVGR